MKKSQFKVIELFVYAVLVAAAIYYAVSHGGFNAPSVTPATPAPTATPTIVIEATPPYIPPPKGEFSP